MASSVPVDKLPTSIDEKNRRTEAIENIGKCRRFSLAQIYDLAGPNRAADVRHDKTHPATHLFIDDTAGPVTQDTEVDAIRCGFFQEDICRIDPALRLRPFAKKTAGLEFIVWHKIRNIDDLLRGILRRVGQRIKFRI